MQTSKRSTAGLTGEARLLRGLVLLAGVTVTAAACDDARDETVVQSHAGSGGAGSAGAFPDGSAGVSGAGMGGRSEIGDASADATPDAHGASDPCVLSTIDEFCSRTSDCPALADARLRLRVSPGFTGPRVIVQRRCRAADGSSRISVGAGYPSTWTKVYVYAADTQRLVGVQMTDDTGDCYDRRYLNEVNFGIVPGYHGEKSLDCAFVVPAECGFPGRLGDLDLDAGDGDGADAGGLRRNECILAPAGTAPG